MIAAVSGAALLIIMFIVDWFGGGGSIDTGVGTIEVDAPGANAWDSMELIRFVLLLTGLAAVGLAVMEANGSRPDLPVAGSALIAGLGILSTVLILYRILDTPFDSDREIGVFLGLIAAAGVAYGGWEAMKEEGTSFTEQRDHLQTRDPGAPPPPPAV